MTRSTEQSSTSEEDCRHMNRCLPLQSNTLSLDFERCALCAHGLFTGLQATRDYNVGEPPETSTVAVAAELGLRLREDFAARTFDFEGDTVHFDMILVMDKFTAGDVMREVGTCWIDNLGVF